MAAGLEKDTFIPVAKEGHYNLSVFWPSKVRLVCMIKQDTAASCLPPKTERVGVAVCRVSYRVP
jgi:hypothetical protein